MSETQSTINAWQRERFPTAAVGGVIGHLREEFREFLTAVPGTPEAAEEAADIVILLYCIAMLEGFDLHAEIDKKMAKNRTRQWVIQPDGTGRHVREDRDA